MTRTTGRAAIHAALKAPLQADGWRPRAAGWFTREVGGPWLGVLAVSTATKYSPAGHADATVHVGHHHKQVESEVARLTGVAPSYRLRTFLTSIGYLMPQRRWTEWAVDSADAAPTAAAMADAIHRYAEPYLARVAGNPAAALKAEQRHWLDGSVVDLARLLSVSQILEGQDLASLIPQIRSRLAGLDDAATRQKLELLERIQTGPHT